MLDLCSAFQQMIKTAYMQVVGQTACRIRVLPNGRLIQPPTEQEYSLTLVKSNIGTEDPPKLNIGSQLGDWELIFRGSWKG